MKKDNNETERFQKLQQLQQIEANLKKAYRILEKTEEDWDKFEVENFDWIHKGKTYNREVWDETKWEYSISYIWYAMNGIEDMEYELKKLRAELEIPKEEH